MVRDKTLDITKGIGIILVIIGHFSFLPLQVWKFIFSFHMPLFFIVSGYLFKPKGIKESLSKDFKRLMIPYFVTCLIILAFYLAYWLKSGDGSQFNYYLIASLVGNGSKNHECMFLSNLPSIGAIWFFPALLVCRNVYGALRPNKRLLWSAIIFVLATLLGRYVIFNPFSVLSGLSAILFFAIGDRLKEVRHIRAPIWVFGGLCWVVCLLFSTLSLARPRLDFYFLDVIGATFATLSVYLLLRSFSGMDCLAKPLSWLGQQSLSVLCFHLIDLDCGLSGMINLWGDQWITCVLRFLFPIGGTLCLSLYKRYINNHSLGHTF